MPLKLKNLDELLDIAIHTTSLDEMFFLKTHPSMNVRRNLARNRNINDSILEDLVFDPVQNVSYIASIHPKAKEKRDYSNLRPCVTCEKSEVGLYCVTCHHVAEHKF